MAKRRHAQGGGSPGRRPQGPRRARQDQADSLKIRPIPETDQFELVYPNCAGKCKEDMEEVHKMLEAGEVDIAIDELRWLLDACRGLLEAHKLLGEIALSDGDLELARAHLGYAYDMVTRSLPRDGLPGTLPYARQPNRPFFEAGKGLAWCLRQQKQEAMAADVVKQLLVLDPSDPLNLREIIADQPET